ncbi:phosphatidate cytidylyltransferase [Paludibacter sp.]|uniref:phosphatidate cytidylyltransferase n=1 Tax=Paludibacter sp. TaxID=1898105 RepID=UPI001355ACF8|nr:phosphatidate cytidylyltransferase [Paludibacter sp.]MTK52763.1 phosphatidate cytidylyltransferase [Paludibacter sp.]
MKNLIQRAITGVLFVGAIVGSVFLGKIAFASLFFWVTVLTQWELYTLINTKGSAQINRQFATLASAFLYLSTLLWNQVSAQIGIICLAVYVLFCFGIVIYELFRKDGNPLHNWAYFFLGQIYVVVPFSMLNILNHSFEPEFLLALFVLIWTYDSGAYLFGVTLGKHRLFERISPKKSWEGAIGGFLAACVAALIFAHFSSSLSVFGWIGFAALVVVFGTFGDLAESLLKRTFNIKDSGNILPGHGGMLDRFDSLLFATPVILIYLAILIGENCFI